jgi:hypothetical protein
VTNSTATIIQKIASEDCCNCNTYSIVSGEKERTLPIEYIDCNNVRQSTNIIALASLTVCMVPGSLQLVKDYLVTVTNLGDCS